MIAPELNVGVKSKLVTLGYTNIAITPLIAYADSAAPFITFNEYVSTRSVEQFWLRQSVIMYYIYDNDASRAKNIGKALDSLLNVGDDTNEVNALITGARDYRLSWMRLTSGNMFPALEREGFMAIVRAYEIGYIEV